MIARLGLKPHVSHLMVILFDAAYPALDDLITADESHVAQAIIDPGGGVIAVFLDPCHDVVAVGIQPALSIARM